MPPQNLYQRLQSTLAAHSIDRTTAQVLSLQLAGGVPSDDPTGRDHGHIHLAALFEAETDVTALLTHLSELSPAGTYVNGSGATFVGLIGGGKGGDVNRGVALSGDYDHLYIGNAAALNDRIKDATEQILSRSAYTITKSGIHETYSVDSALLFADTLRGGERDEYISLSEEFDYVLPLAPRRRCDVLIVDAGEDDHITTTGPSLNITEAHDGLEAARDIEPTIPELVLEEIRTRHKDEISGIEYAPLISFESLRQLTVARSRLDYNKTVKSTHVDDIVNLCIRLRKNMGLLDDDDETSESDDCPSHSDVIVVGEDDGMTPRERKQRVKQIIDEVDDENAHGAPIDEVITRVQSELDIKKVTIENIIENLQYKGDAYTPHQGYIRVT